MIGNIVFEPPTGMADGLKLQRYKKALRAIREVLKTEDDCHMCCDKIEALTTEALYAHTVPTSGEGD